MNNEIQEISLFIYSELEINFIHLRQDWKLIFV